MSTALAVSLAGCAFGSLVILVMLTLVIVTVIRARGGE